MSDTQTSDGVLDAHGPAVFAARAQDAALLRDLLQRLHRPPRVLQSGGAAQAEVWCGTHAAPGLLLVDIGGATHPLQQLTELSRLCGPACRIVLIGTRQDVDLYRSLLQNGAFDYLLKPLQLDLLAATLARAEAGAESGAAAGGHGVARAGRTVAVVGACGGAGTSTVVAGLGQLLGGLRQTPTVLVDFDRRKGDLPLLLDLEADAGLATVLAAPQIDSRLLQRTLLSHQGEGAATQRLHLLAQRPERHPPLDPEQALQLGAALCELFSLSVWDLPAHRPDGATEVLAQADVRIVLTDLTVQQARNTHRLLAEIGDESAGQRLLLVANAARHAERPAITRDQFEDFVGRRVDLALPWAGNALASGLLTGPLDIARAPAFQEALLAVADRVLGRPSAAALAAGLGHRLRAWLGSGRPHGPARA